MDASVTQQSDQHLMYIGGSWCESESGETRKATNPATVERIGTVPDGTRADAARAVSAANEAQPELESMSAFERADLSHGLADAIEAERDELAAWLSTDQGKPVSEAIGEVEACVEFFRTAAEDVTRLNTDVYPSQDPNKRIHTIRKPHGVYGVITPWNYPLHTAVGYLSAGLVAGNACVWVPAPTTSVSSIKLMEVLADTALPDGAINLVTGDGPVVGNEVVVNDGTDAIAFTGSPETGEHIAKSAGVKPLLLELGGNGPVIVLEDADIDSAVERTAAACFTNAGQICTASERILVHEAVHDEFVEKLAAIARDVTVGDPAEEGTDMGPLNNRGVAEKMDRHVADAVEKGADLLTGGGRVEGAASPLYYEPTVLDDVTTDMVLNVEESFGPIAPVFRFSEYEEAIEIANGIDYGLKAGIFTSNIQAMYYFAENLQSGGINVNDSCRYGEMHVPGGGYTGKNSGYGRVGGRHTIEEMSQIITITVDVEHTHGLF